MVSAVLVLGCLELTLDDGEYRALGVCQDGHAAHFLNGHGSQKRLAAQLLGLGSHLIAIRDVKIRQPVRGSVRNGRIQESAFRIRGVAVLFSLKFEICHLQFPPHHPSRHYKKANKVLDNPLC